MKLVFWSSLILIVYTYFGYPGVLWIQVRLRRFPVNQEPASRSVSIVIAVRNEEHNLSAKFENLKLLSYPPDKLQIIIVSDGSTDQTASLLLQHGPTILPIILNRHGGKAFALNEGVRRATGEILVFLDVRQSVDPDAISELVSRFGDPKIGAVSGELLLESPTLGSPSDALGIYWKIEKVVRRLESESGSVVGVTGAIYAMRRELYQEIPKGTLLDDVLVPMNVVRAGKRVVFQPTAIARDRFFSQKGKEFSRKVRTLTGNYQLLRLAPWLISPANPLLFRFASHKLLRLFVPFLLVVVLVACALSSGSFYKISFLLQILFYLAAFLGLVRPSAMRLKPIAIANTFVMLNAAAAVAFYNFVTGKNSVWN